MIRSLRRRHLRMIVVLAVLVTVLFVLAIRARPPLPLADLPAAMAFPPDPGDERGDPDGP